jgi:hypothetical protein
VDITGDELLWQDEGEVKVKAAPSDSEFDLYDDSLTNISQDVHN